MEYLRWLIKERPATCTMTAVVVPTAALLGTADRVWFTFAGVWLLLVVLWSSADFFSSRNAHKEDTERKSVY